MEKITDHLNERINAIQKDLVDMKLVIETVDNIQNLLNTLGSKINQSNDLNNKPFQELDDLNEGLDRIGNIASKILEAK